MKSRNNNDQPITFGDAQTILLAVLRRSLNRTHRVEVFHRRGESSFFCHPRTRVFGFVEINQLVCDLALSDVWQDVTVKTGIAMESSPGIMWLPDGVHEEAGGIGIKHFKQFVDGGTHFILHRRLPLLSDLQVQAVQDLFRPADRRGFGPSFYVELIAQPMDTRKVGYPVEDQPKKIKFTL